MEKVWREYMDRRWDNGRGMPLGIYISVPFCRTKCSYCNFASDVFSRAVFERYVDRVCADIGNAPQVATEMGGQIERAVDSIYLGGGTPTVLEAAQLERIFARVRRQFDVQPDAEVTVECAPGTLTAGRAREPAALRCEPREPGSAVVCGSGSGGGWPPAQARDRARRHCPRCGLRELRTSISI